MKVLHKQHEQRLPFIPPHPRQLCPAARDLPAETVLTVCATLQLSDWVGHGASWKLILCGN